MIIKKNCLLEIKSVNPDKHQVTFYFATWEKDRDGDTINPKAFDKTLIENKDYIYHNIDHEGVIGKPIAFGTDEKGAWCTSELSMNTDDGKDGYNKYMDGLIKGHSQEFVVKSAKPDPKGGRLLNELELWGVTSMTKIPANAEATTISVKSATEVAMGIRHINAVLDGPDIEKKCTTDFLHEYKKLEYLLYKNKALKLAGMVHCDNCKTLLPPMPIMDITIAQDEDMSASDADYNQKCPDCGRFVNKNGQSKNSNMTTEKKKSVISLDAVNKFRTELKGKKEDNKVIGSTWSDKAIHSDPSHEGHDDFTQGEHEQAANKHLELARMEAKSAMDADSEKDKGNYMDSANDHVDKAAEHMKMSFKCMK